MQRKRIYFLLIFATFILNSCATQTPFRRGETVPDPLRQLQAQLDQIYADPLLSQAQCAIKVKSMDTGEVLYQRNSRLLFSPASNMKLLTTATALYKLGVDYRFKTLLAADSAAIVPGDTVLHGNLYLWGGADPLFSQEDLLELASHLRSMGISQINGDLVADPYFLDSLELGKGWMWDDEPEPYSAHLSALSLNENCVAIIIQPGDAPGDSVRYIWSPPNPEIRIRNLAVTCAPADSFHLIVERDFFGRKNLFTIRGTYPLHAPPDTALLNIENPALFTISTFSALLRDMGIGISGGYRIGAIPANAETLYVHESPPLAQIVHHTNKISDNLAAELILKTLGAELKGTPGTAEKGLQVIREFLQDIQVDSTAYKIVDGSGLSRYNLITADLIVELLNFMYHNFNVQAEFLASLPIGGVDGTLSDRLTAGRAFRNLRAKTGTMEGISSLSGYVATADGEILAFSILMQNFLGSAQPYRMLQDRIGTVLANFSRKAAGMPHISH